MAEVSREAVADLLLRLGLEGPAIDIDEAATTLNGWYADGTALDELLIGFGPADVTAFDPRWS